MPDILCLSQTHIDEMLAHAEACDPEEGCGLLAGTGRQVEFTILITNQAHSLVRYNMEPKELIEAFFDIEDRGMKMLATFHSHPTGPSMPSATDLTGYAYPEAPMIILSKEMGIWGMKGFKILDGTVKEIDLRIE